MTGLSFYYIAFEELSSCRAIGMGVGPIPWTAMDIYCQRYGLEDDDYEDFFHLVWALDRAYLEHTAIKDK